MNRLERIIQLVSQKKKIDVNSLSEQLDVSKVTIRKDLDKLESKGLLRREHGYAVLNSGDDLNVRLSYNYNIKRRIAEKAAELVQDNDTIMIESGSTCALLAEVLCQTKRNIKVITNSCFIANYIRQYSSCQIILLGGYYQPNSEVTVGPFIERNDIPFSCQSCLCWNRRFQQRSWLYGQGHDALRRGALHGRCC